jgi:hypothetical protein
VKKRGVTVSPWDLKEAESSSLLKCEWKPRRRNKLEIKEVTQLPDNLRIWQRCHRRD